jgi:endonuclease YncB( thermonuclease family)
LDGKNVNLEMDKSGLAEVYLGGPPPSFDDYSYHKAERKAREAGRGMWVFGESV